MGTFWLVGQLAGWVFGILLAAGLIIAFVAWRFVKLLKRDVDLNLPDWDVIPCPSTESLQSVATATPGQFGLIGSLIGNWFFRRHLPKLLAKNRNDLSAWELNTLGEAFDNGGAGFPRNPAEAFRLFVEADSRQSQPHPWATMRAGEMLEDGEGTPRDPDGALRYYVRRPASVSAILHVARRFFEGDGVPRNLVKAYELLLVAEKFADHMFDRAKVEREHVRAARRHLVVRRLLIQVGSEMSPEQRNAALTSAVAMWGNGNIELGVNTK